MFIVKPSIDKLMLGSFENLNLSLGVGGVYMLSDHISLGLTATYHYFYNQAESVLQDEPNGITTSYKNLYDIYAQLIFNF